jgi:hypothetical protein
MATKRGAGSKKRSASKGRTKEILGNDPPIVISGGGGGMTPGFRGPATNVVFVNFHPKGAPSSAPFESQPDSEPLITGVTISFPGMGVTPVTLNNHSLYNIRIQFTTASGPRPVKRGAAGARKGKSTGKRQPTGKGK